MSIVKPTVPKFHHAQVTMFELTVYKINSCEDEISKIDVSKGAVIKCSGDCANLWDFFKYLRCMIALAHGRPSSSQFWRSIGKSESG